MRHLLEAVQVAYTVERVHEGRQTTMQAENAVLNEGGQRQEVEEVCEGLPHVNGAVFSQALVIKTVSGE